MHCPFCGHTETKVTDSRLAGEGRQIRRRRECLACAERFTTFEAAELLLPTVVKGDRSRERARLHGISPAGRQRRYRDCRESRPHPGVERWHNFIMHRREFRRGFGYDHPNLRRAALLAERLAVFDAVTALVAEMIHRK